MKQLEKGLSVVLSLISLPLTANAALIDFEKQAPQPCTFAEAPALISQYEDEGVTFDGGWEVLNQCGNFGLDARSGEHFAAFAENATNLIPPTQTLGLTFEGTVNQIAGFVGGRDPSEWTITAFLSGNSVVEQILENPGGEFTGFSLANFGFADRVTITTNDRQGVVDDISFQFATPVSEPATLGLLGLGLIGIRRMMNRG